jgi:hypothetical protein
MTATDPKRDELFWTQVCNARVSDRIGDIPLMRINSIPWRWCGRRSLGSSMSNHQVGSCVSAPNIDPFRRPTMSDPIPRAATRCIDLMTVGQARPDAVISLKRENLGLVSQAPNGC